MFKNFPVVGMVVTAALAFAGVAVSPAYADLPNERPTTEGVLWNAVQIADKFWAAAGYEVPPVQLFTYNDPADTALARGRLGGCLIWFQERFVKRFKKIVNNPSRYSWLDRRAEYKLLCKAAIHERGHNLGFEHAHDGSIMEAHPEDQGTPGVCIDWAAKSVRGPKPLRPKRR